MSKRGIGLTVIFKSCRTLYCCQPQPFLSPPNRLTDTPNYLVYVPDDSFSMTVFHRLNQTTVDIFNPLRILRARLTMLELIMMAVHLTPFTTAPVFPALLLRDCNVPRLRSTIIFTFSIIPYFILFVKYYFCNQHPNCNTSRK